MTQQQLITPINPDTFENTAQLIMGCDLDLAIREVEQAIEVSTTPGKLVTIQSRAYDNCCAKVELMPDGQISFSSNRIVQGRFYLPNPAMLGAEKLGSVDICDMRRFDILHFVIPALLLSFHYSIPKELISSAPFRCPAGRQGSLRPQNAKPEP